MQIFISHTAEENELARRIAARLSQAGVRVWNPDTEIDPGDNWAKKVGQALDESDVMVVLFSRAARDSGTLRRDIEYALTSKNYERRLVPVIVDMATFQAGKDVPWILLKMDPVYVESANAELDQIVERIQAIAERDFNAAR